MFDMTDNEAKFFCVGFYLGDGSIITKINPKNNTPQNIIIDIEQIDPRPLETFKKTFNCGNIRGPYIRKGRENSSLSWHYTCGKIEEVLKIVNLMWDHLPLFRKEQAYRVLNNYYTAKVKRDYVPDFSTQKWYTFVSESKKELSIEGRTYRENLALAAGIYSSEGSCWYGDCTNRNTGRLGLNVSQTCLEPLTYFRDVVLNLVTVSPEQLKSNIKHKSFYTATTNDFQKIKTIIEMLWFALSEPKREQYKLALEKYNESQKNKKDFGWHNKEKTHCKHGHEFTEENIYHQDGKRRCRICRRIQGKEQAKRHREREKLKSQ